MKGVELKRVYSGQEGTFGIIVIEGVFFCVSLEKPWKDNRSDISCIPAGTYKCKRVQSPRFGNTFEICNVEGRTHILFHAGNTEKDTRGCVLLGEGMTNRGITQSRKALKKFFAELEGIDEFLLTISEVA